MRKKINEAKREEIKKIKETEEEEDKKIRKKRKKKDTFRSRKTKKKKKVKKEENRARILPTDLLVYIKFEVVFLKKNLAGKIQYAL